MKKKNFWGGLVLLLVFLSCKPFTIQEPEVIVVTATSPAEEAVAPPVEYPAAGIMIKGLAADTGDGLTFYDHNGGVIYKVPLSDTSVLSPGHVHIAGNYLEGLTGVPVIYFSLEDHDTLLLKNVNGPSNTLLDVSAFAGMAGAPGLPVFAYSRVDFNDMLSSELYAGSLALLPVAPVLTSDQQATDSWPFKPLAVEAQDGQPSGIWYTTIAYGIGGDIVFEPRKGLYYLDMTTRNPREILDRGYNPSCLSFDRTWVAYTPSGVTTAGLTLYNIQNGANVSFPLLPAQDQRGAGDAVISPGNQYVAWMEGAGWIMAETPSFHATVRVGDFNGTVIADYVDTSLSGVSGLAEAQWAAPVAWLDDQTLIIQVRGLEWDQSALVKFDIVSRNLSYYGSGSYVGLLYP